MWRNEEINASAKNVHKWIKVIKDAESDIVKGQMRAEILVNRRIDKNDFENILRNIKYDEQFQIFENCIQSGWKFWKKNKIECNRIKNDDIKCGILMAKKYLRYLEKGGEINTSDSVNVFANGIVLSYGSDKFIEVRKITA